MSDILSCILDSNGALNVKNQKFMAAGKWIGGILGFMSGGALGALAGVALGALFDYGINAVNKDGEPKNGYGSTSSGRQGFGSATREQQYYEGQRNRFFVLSACSGVVYY